MTGENALIQLFGSTPLWKPSTCQLDSAANVLHDKVVLLYFSAYWCAPCSYFTPVLIQFYEALEERRRRSQQQQSPPTECERFEVVYCGMDRNEAQYRKYTQKMPWYCVPFGIPQVTSALVTHFGAHNIPFLVVIDRDGCTVLTKDGVGEVSLDPQGERFPWRPQPFSQILPKQLFTKRTRTNCVCSEQLRHKHLLLYFSAQWCPPCREFTPLLCNAYKNLLGVRNDFEVSFWLSLIPPPLRCQPPAGYHTCVTSERDVTKNQNPNSCCCCSGMLALQRQCQQPYMCLTQPVNLFNRLSL